MTAQPGLFKRYSIMAATAWTFLLLVLLQYEQYTHRKEMLNLAQTEARAAFDKDVLYRRWNAMHGGVYAPVTEKTYPNPLLANIPERDITTSSGRRLTLINPAYMTRQVHEIAALETGIRGHITSLRPIQPNNAPDEWETKALQAFERGETEFSSVELMEGTKYLRYMQPLKTEEPCLRCHASQGYKTGDVRGGISVSVPLKSFLSSYNRTLKSNLTAYGIIWLAGLIMIMAGSRQLSAKTRRIRDIASSIGEGVYALNKGGNVTFVNPEAERLLGWTESELLGKTIHDRIHSRRPDGSYLSFEECPIYKVIRTGERFNSRDEVFIRKDGSTFPVSIISAPLVEDGKVVASITAFRDITERKQIEQEREHLIMELQKALAEIRTLHGILPICSYCKKIRDDKGAWTQLESYISGHTDALFSHGLCHECAEKMYPKYYKKNDTGETDN